MNNYSNLMDSQLENFLLSCLHEDGLGQMLHLHAAQSDQLVKTKIKWKSNVIVAGMPFVCFLINKFCKYEKLNLTLDSLLKLEGKKKSVGDETVLELPFASFITLERTMLNLLHRLSAIATTTNQFVTKTNSTKIKILDTRKTTPGLRSLERYAVTVGGGVNHRNDLTDTLMIKDNHKVFFGGLEKAWEFYTKQKSFYQVIIVEIHNIEELKLGMKLGAKHFMLDNFSNEQIVAALKLKEAHHTFEISGGVNLENIKDFLQPGIDAISLSGITFWPNRIDISWKIFHE